MDDEISQGPDREGRPFRMPSWLTAAAVAGLVTVVAVLTVTRSLGHGSGRHDGSARASIAAAAPPVSTAPVSPAPPVPPGSAPAAPAPFVAAGTALLTCDSVSPRRLKSDWRAGSLRIGTLWLVGGLRFGYARPGAPGADRSPGADGSGGAHKSGGADGSDRSGGDGGPDRSGGDGGPSRDVDMLVHVDGGSTVVMRAATGTSPYFEFLNSPATTGDYQGLDGGRGYTLAPCPGAGTGHGGTGFYDLGFSIVPGHAASVEIWTSRTARPVWVTFTAPA